MDFDGLISRPNQPASARSLDGVGRDLPKSLCRLLLRADGGFLHGDAVLKVPDGSTSGSIELLSARNIDNVTRSLLGSSTDRVVWARDGSGNALTMSADGSVFFWDHDTGEQQPFGCGLDRLAECFELRPEPSAALSSPMVAPLEVLLERAADIAAVAQLLDEALDRGTAPSFMKVAVHAERLDVAKEILRRDVLPAEVREHALHMASTRGMVELVDALLTAGADIESRRSVNGFTPLMTAASAGQLDVVRLLLERGADATATTRRGFNAERLALIAKRAGVAAHLRARRGI